MMPSLQIRFVSGKGWDSKIIEWCSRCRWSHVELLWPGDHTFGAQLKGGVRWRKTNDHCYRKAIAAEVWQIPITDEQQTLLQKLIADAEGAPYDWLAILSFALGYHRFHLAGAWICSGYLAGVVDSLNLLTMVFDPENYSPRDVYMLVPNIPGATRLA